MQKISRELDVDKILKTVEQLSKRVAERFPERSINRVCTELHEAVLEAKEEAAEIAKPNIWLRIGIGAMVLAVVGVSIMALIRLEFSFADLGMLDVFTLIESGINDLIFISAGIYFLLSLENRMNRRTALNKLNELRALAHVIDMHQLTKDPVREYEDMVNTKSSPQRDMTAFELFRYLDYCSEMLSHIGKICAFYVQNFNDPVVLGAVNEIEGLTTGLSREIWQKIMIIHQLEDKKLVGSKKGKTKAKAKAKKKK